MGKLSSKFRSLYNPRYLCCRSMGQFYTPKQERNKGKPIVYSPVFKSYGLVLNYDAKDFNSTVSMEFCPFCGNRLPDEGLIEDAWYTCLENEFGLSYDPKDNWEQFFESVPEEFKTDEWWIKRGL